MNEELIQKAMAMFNTPEKWVAFTDLVDKQNVFQERWWKNLQAEVYQRETQTGNPDWDIKIWGNWDIKWFIRGENENSLAIHFWADFFRIFSNYGFLDTEKVNKLIEDQRFNIIKTSFDRIDGSDWATIGWEIRNFSFGTDYDGKFPHHRILSWYAGNRTKEFADQLIAKVRKFQTPEITALFKEINKECIKNN